MENLSGLGWQERRQQSDKEREVWRNAWTSRGSEFDQESSQLVTWREGEENTEDSKRGHKKSDFTGLAVPMDWREILISPREMARALHQKARSQVTLCTYKLHCWFIIWLPFAELLLPHLLLQRRQCVFSAFGSAGPPGARDVLDVAGDVMVGQVQRKGWWWEPFF